MRKYLLILLILASFTLFAAQRYVVGEVFTSDPGC